MSHVGRRRDAPFTDKVLVDPAASTWLKSSLEAALDRDPADAANDAEILADLLIRRADSASRQDLRAVDENVDNGLDMNVGSSPIWRQEIPTYSCDHPQSSGVVHAHVTRFKANVGTVAMAPMSDRIRATFKLLLDSPGHRHVFGGKNQIADLNAVRYLVRRQLAEVDPASTQNGAYRLTLVGIAAARELFGSNEDNS